MCTFFAQSQIMGNILGEVTRKINRKVEEKLVKVISDEIVRRAFNPVEKTMDSLMRQQYQDSLGTQGEVDWEKWSEAYTDYLANMNKTVDLPQSYNFNLIHKVETTNNKDKSLVTLYYSEDNSVFGIETEDNKESKNIIVLDIEKDAAIMYTIDNKGEKSGQIVPNFFKMASALGSPQDNTNNNPENITINATGKTKTVAGLNCKEYIGESENDNFTMYVTTEFPLEKDKSMDRFFMKFAPESYNRNNSYKNIEGVMMAYENISKTNKSDTSTWSTISVKKESFMLDNKDFGLIKE